MKKAAKVISLLVIVCLVFGLALAGCGGGTKNEAPKAEEKKAADTPKQDAPKQDEAKKEPVKLKFTYAPTGGWFNAPNNGSTVNVNVSLNAGTNTIKFEKGTNYAELDYIDFNTGTAQPSDGTTRYEAETATVNHSNLFSSSYTSMGQYVGQIDYADSYVQFTVNVPTTKAYTMTVRYSNGTTGNSTHKLSINGGASTTITYPKTGSWFNEGLGSTVTQSVNLNAGNNTIRFTKGTTGYAEFDHIEIK